MFQNKGTSMDEIESSSIAVLYCRMLLFIFLKELYAVKYNINMKIQALVQQ